MRTMLVALALATTLAGCADTDRASEPRPDPSPTATATPGATDGENALTWTAELRLSWTGGLCPDGPCARSVVVEEATGAWQMTGSDSGDGPMQGAIAPSAVADVADWLDARWDRITAAPFEGTCPTAYDGQELTVELAFLPGGPQAHLADADRRITSSCTHAWPEGFAEEFLSRWDAAGVPR